MQDKAPEGGFPQTIKYKRNLPRRGPSGAVVLLAVGGIMTYGLIQLKNDSHEKRELRREKTWARIYCVPLLQAEIDRDTSRRLDALKIREEQIMADRKGWNALDLKQPTPGIGKFGRDDQSMEPVYHTERYVAPSLIFIPKEEKSFMSAQWWRGTKIFTKNPTYQDRDDFTKEHPIGK